MIPPSLGGQATLANMFVTHHWCQQQYYRIGRQYLPPDPSRFLAPGEAFREGRAVHTGESLATHH